MTSTADPSTRQSAARRTMPSYPQIVKIMNLVRKEEEFAEIEDQIKADPAISCRLMTYINSAAMGFLARASPFARLLPSSAITSCTAG